jgi:hypothetical protein
MESATENRLVSAQTTLQTVDAIGAGLDRLKQEIDVQKRSRDVQPNDRFVQIMEVMVDQSSIITANSIIFSQAFCYSKNIRSRSLEEDGQGCGCGTTILAHVLWRKS